MSRFLCIVVIASSCNLFGCSLMLNLDDERDNGGDTNSFSVSFEPAAYMNVGRSSHTATLLDSGRVLIAGGWTDSAEEYDSTNDQFNECGTMSISRADHTATLLGDGRVLITGGVDDDEFALSCAETYNPQWKTNSTIQPFSLTKSMHSPRRGHTAVLLPDGKVLVAGGYDNMTLIRATELFDPLTNSFSTISGMIADHYDHTATVVGNKVFIMGGNDSGINEEYDISAKKFIEIEKSTSTRYHHTATLLQNGKILVAGGADNDDNILSSAEILDPSTGKFSSTGRMKVARQNHTATLLPNGKVLITGGSTTQYLSSAELFDPTTGTFTLVNDMTTPRSEHTATLLHTGRVLIVGGYIGNDKDLLSSELSF